MIRAKHFFYPWGISTKIKKPDITASKGKNGLKYPVLDVTYHFRIQHYEKDVIYFLITQWNQRC